MEREERERLGETLYAVQLPRLVKDHGTRHYVDRSRALCYMNSLFYTYNTKIHNSFAYLKTDINVIFWL